MMAPGASRPGDDELTGGRVGEGTTVRSASPMPPVMSGSDPGVRVRADTGRILSLSPEHRPRHCRQALRMLQDFRYSLRLLRKTPGFTAIAVLVLALGIGANTAVFSLVDTLLLHPRLGRIDSLVAVFNRDRVKASEFSDFSYPAYVDLRDRSGVFDSLLAHSFTTVGIRDGELTRQAFATIVSSNYFETLGVGLAAGRTFTAEEERPGAGAQVAIASYAV